MMEGGDEKIKRGSRVTTAQRRPLYEAVRNRPKLIVTKFSSSFTHKDSDRLWQEVAEVVNAHGGGPPKTPQQWMKRWADERRNVKSRQSEILKSLRKTGGGPSDVIPLTPIEADILALIGGTTIIGHESVLIPHIGVEKVISTEPCPLSAEDESDMDHPEPPAPQVESHSEVTFPNVTARAAPLPSCSGDALKTTPQIQSGSNVENIRTPKQKRLPHSLQTAAKQAADKLAHYRAELIGLRQNELEIKRKDLELREMELPLKKRKILALESIAKSLANKYGV